MKLYKRIQLKINYLLLFVFVLGSLSLHAKTPESFSHERTKIYEKTVTINKNHKLKISNQYGKVELLNWDRPEIKVVVNIKVKEGSASKAEDALNRIRINESIEANMISYETLIAKGEGNSWKDLFSSQPSSLSIDYQVYLPDYNDIIINNQYGNILMKDRNGSTNIKLNYGKLEAGNLQGRLNVLSINYGEANINYLSTSNATIQYSKMNLKRANTLMLKLNYSSGSTIQLIENLLEGSVNYSGNFRVGVSENFKKLDLKSNYSTLILDTHNKGIFNFDVSASYGNLLFDKNYAHINSEKKGNISKHITGKWAPNSRDRQSKTSLSSEVFIKSTYGSVTFR